MNPLTLLLESFPGSEVLLESEAQELRLAHEAWEEMQNWRAHNDAVKACG